MSSYEDKWFTWLDPGSREKAKGFAMLIDVGTIALILSDRRDIAAGVQMSRRKAERERRWVEISREAGKSKGMGGELRRWGGSQGGKIRRNAEKPRERKQVQKRQRGKHETRRTSALSRGIEQMRSERKSRRPDGVRGGAEEKSTDKEEGESRRTGKGWRNSGKRCPILE